MPHFPSRLGGEKETEELREKVAQEPKMQADLITRVRRNPRIVMMGDFNDYPNCKSLYEVLGAKSPTDRTAAYINLMLPLTGKESVGSHKFESEWGILRSNHCQPTPLKHLDFILQSNTGNIYADFLLEEDTKYGGKRPFRTYVGMKYHGGYSDHLPVFIDLQIKTKLK